MHYFLTLMVSIVFLACSHSKEKALEKERVSLKAPVNQKIISSDLQVFRKQISCENCTTTKLIKSMNEHGFIRLPIANFQRILNSLKDNRTVVFSNGNKFFELYGVELRDEVLFAIDKERIPKRFSFKSFMSQWENGGYWAQSFLLPKQLGGQTLPKDLVPQAYLMEKANPKGATSLYKHLIDLGLHPELTYSRLHRVDSKASNGELLNIYEKGIAIHPNKRVIWNGYVRLLKKTGKRQKALQVENKVAQMFGFGGQRLL